MNVTRVFKKLEKMAIMLTLASEALLCENRMLPQVRIKPGTSDSKSYTLLSELTWYLLIKYFRLLI